MCYDIAIIVAAMPLWGMISINILIVNITYVIATTPLRSFAYDALTPHVFRFRAVFGVFWANSAFRSDYRGFTLAI